MGILHQELYEKLARKLIDEGKLIEAGWVGLRHMSMHPDAPPVQVEEMRKAFFAGAQHVFASIIGMLEAGTEPTANDVRRMDLINTELEQWVAQMKAQGRSNVQ